MAAFDEEDFHVYQHAAPANYFRLDLQLLSAPRTYTVPNLAGTLALTDATNEWSGLQDFRSAQVRVGAGGFELWNDAGTFAAAFARPFTANRTLTLPDATTTLAGLSVAQTWTAVQTFNAASAVPVFSNAYDADALSILNTDSGFKVSFRTNSAFPLTADRTITCVDATGVMMLLTATQNATNKTFSSCILSITSNVLRTSTSSSGVAFEDNTTSTKKLRVVLSGAVGNSSFVIANTAARAYTFPDIAGTVAIGVGTAVNAASTDLDTVIALCNQLRAILIANGQAV